MEETKINAIYSTLKLMNENTIIEFLIKIETMDFNKIKDKTTILKYVDLINNYAKICNELDLNKTNLEKLNKARINVIKHLNDRTLKEQSL